MARQDIYTDAVHGEVETTDNRANKVIYGFLLLDEIPVEDNDNYRYGEISVPSGFETKYKDKNGIHIYIPYTPIYKQLKLRFRIEHANGSTEYILNKTDNKLWYPVFRETEGNEKESIFLPEFIGLNENGFYNLILKDGYLSVYSGDETDFEIKAALKQNEIFLLKAGAGNLYQFPTTGVGLIDFLHGNFENTGLAAKLQQEFENDNMLINEAYMDSITGELYLDVKEKNG
ncbi:hypothetical protein [Dysgonomonas sp. 520]|uniref:hypothetical protein n=1 Tax=Dysgonomonas sp. 520 TaxID=2302931 RepID=UPI0013D7EA99|nr:hypothetical protein [Dysgonomonas sp. 520]NDW10984.1 hypothetical protein [Dysgonomonas sp. 520]